MSAVVGDIHESPLCACCTRWTYPLYADKARSSKSSKDYINSLEHANDLKGSVEVPNSEKSNASQHVPLCTMYVAESSPATTHIKDTQTIPNPNGSRPLSNDYRSTLNSIYPSLTHLTGTPTDFQHRVVHALLDGVADVVPSIVRARHKAKQKSESNATYDQQVTEENITRINRPLRIELVAGVVLNQPIHQTKKRTHQSDLDLLFPGLRRCGDEGSKPDCEKDVGYPLGRPQFGYVVCADGGANRIHDLLMETRSQCNALPSSNSIYKENITNILATTVDAVVGDLDSVRTDILKEFVSKRYTKDSNVMTPIVLHSHDQNTNDLQKCLVHLSDVQSVLNLLGNDNDLVKGRLDMNSRTLMILVQGNVVAELEFTEHDSSQILKRYISEIKDKSMDKEWIEEDINKYSDSDVKHYTEGMLSQQDKYRCPCSCHTTSEYVSKNDELTKLGTIEFSSIEFCFDTTLWLGALGGRFDHEIGGLATAYKMTKYVHEDCIKSTKESSYRQCEEWDKFIAKYLDKSGSDQITVHISPRGLIASRIDPFTGTVLGPFQEVQTKIGGNFFDLVTAVHEVKEERNKSDASDDSDDDEDDEDSKITHKLTFATDTLLTDAASSTLKSDSWLLIKIGETISNHFQNSSSSKTFEPQDFVLNKIHVRQSDDNNCNEEEECNEGYEMEFNTGSIHGVSERIILAGRESICMVITGGVRRKHFIEVNSRRKSTKGKPITCGILPVFHGYARVVTRGLVWDIGLDLQGINGHSDVGIHADTPDIHERNLIQSLGQGVMAGELKYNGVVSSSNSIQRGDPTGQTSFIVRSDRAIVVSVDRIQN